LKKITALAVVSGLAATALLSAQGTAVADHAARTGDMAPHSTAPVTSLINGDVAVGNNLTVPIQIAVPILGGKVGPYQGGNENAASQADGSLGEINSGGDQTRANPRPLTLTAQQVGINPLAVQFTVDNQGQGEVKVQTGDPLQPDLTVPGDTQSVPFVYSQPGTYTVKATDADDPSRLATAEVTVTAPARPSEPTAR